MGAYGGSATDRPRAFLNYILFDHNFNYVSSYADRVSDEAGFEPNQDVVFDELTFQTKAEQGGYIYIYVSNETPGVKVYFDDLTISHTQGIVTQATDFGVWGDVMRQVSSPVQSDNTTSLKKNLVAQYLFNSSAQDLSGRGLHGTVNGATLTTDSDGNLNSAYSFDGVDDKITLLGTEDDFSFIQNTGVFTISAYVKLDNLTSRSVIIASASTTTNRGFALMYENYDAQYGIHQLRFTSTNGSSGSANIAKGAGYKINDTGWHHIVVVGDGQKITFYVDGVQDGNSTSITVFSSGNSTWPTVIGANNDVNGNTVLPFKGSIDEVHIFDRPLTLDEIQLLKDKKDVETNDNVITTQQKYRYGYQGQFAEKDEETGLNHFELREYDAVIGRWNAKDPYRQYWSPYVGMGNNPISGTDPDGGCTDCPNNGKLGDKFMHPDLGELTLTGMGWVNGDGATIGDDAYTGVNEMTPVDVGKEWLTGLGPPHRDFFPGDTFTEMVKTHSHVKQTEEIIARKFANNETLLGVHRYRLNGVEGVGKYLKDYSTLLTAGKTGNLAVTYLGSYSLNYRISDVDVVRRTLRIHFTVENNSTAQSAFRPPIIGYEPAWTEGPGRWIGNAFQTGPLSPKSQSINWSSTIKY